MRSTGLVVAKAEFIRAAVLFSRKAPALGFDISGDGNNNGTS
jgi:hypothetical protein